MLVKSGVDISRLGPKIRKSLTVVEKVLAVVKIELVVTSTYEGNHSAGSLHYANLAVDIRSDGVNEEVVEEMRDKLGPTFDVVAESTHIHIEYDPK